MLELAAQFPDGTNLTQSANGKIAEDTIRGQSSANEFWELRGADIAVSEVPWPLQDWTSRSSS
jgi:hypothetical protein